MTEVKLTITPESNVDKEKMCVIDNDKVELVVHPREKILSVYEIEHNLCYTLPAFHLNLRKHLLVINLQHYRILHMLS
jgi:hypothetical protein